MKKMMSIIKLNIKIVFCKFWAVLGIVFTAISMLLCFFSWEDFSNPNLCCRLIALTIVFVLAFFISLITVVSTSTRTVWENGSGKVVLKYGDLMKIGFPKKPKSNQVVVVPVNTHFDTIVDENISDVSNPLVSSNTLHGQWLMKMYNTMTCEELNSKIQENLHTQGIAFSSIDRPRGNTDEYPSGTVAIVQGQNGISFFLLALSSFDDNNNAQSSKEILVKAINSLIDFYDKHAQGNRMYVPVMGTGLSRIGLSEQEALEILLSVIKLKSGSIHGEIIIVIYNNSKDTLSIWQD